MIVPMKKAGIIVQTKDADSAVRTVQRLGILHIEHRKAPKGKSVTFLQEEISFFENAIKIISDETAKGGCVPQDFKEPKDHSFISHHIVDLNKRIIQLEEYSRTLMQTIEQYEPWEDFDPDIIHSLAEKNIYIRLYQILPAEMNKLPDGIIVNTIARKNGVNFCVIVTRGKTEIPFKEIQPPKMSLGKMKAKLSEESLVIKSIRNEIIRHFSFRDSLIQVKKGLEEELEFKEALSGMGEEGTLSYITGYIPDTASAALLKTAKEQKWGIILSKPTDEDNVPTLLKNPKWISIINPVFKLIEVVPGYRELDISLWFLVFFSIFFGMLIGDAGDGAVFFLLTLFANLKFGKKVKNKSIFTLFYILSGCAVIWGVLSGTFFGQEWLAPYIKPLWPALRDDKYVQTICFLLGAIHLSIGHSWRAILKAPSLEFLSDIGWVFILWGAFFLARFLILGYNFVSFAKWFFIIGIVLVLFFTKPSKNILKTVGTGTGTLLLNFVNSFTDVVSYIRLFAVGLATVAVADAFNKMAMDVGFGSVTSGFITAFVLILGHSLNVVLGPMSVLVHGVRLNVLEFCSHADIKWSGIEYKPLQERSK